MDRRPAMRLATKRDTSRKASRLEEVSWVIWMERALTKPLAEAKEAIDSLPLPKCEEDHLRQKNARQKVVQAMLAIDLVSRAASALGADIPGCQKVSRA